MFLVRRNSLFKVSHKQLASFLHGVITKHENVELDYRSFLFGSIKPDLTSEILLIPHYFDNMNRHHLFDKIQAVQKEIIEGVIPAALADFSERMGEIMHYLCDYFCLPHSSPAKHKMGVIRHNIYERRLARYLKKQTITEPTSPNCTVNFNHYFLTESSFVEWISLLNTEYHSQPTSFKKDVHFSLSISLSVLWYVFQLEQPFPQVFLPETLMVAA
jgi:hypothetical protein